MSRDSRKCKQFAMLCECRAIVARVLRDIRATCMLTPPGEFWPKFRREFVRHSCNIRATYANVS